MILIMLLMNCKVSSMWYIDEYLLFLSNKRLLSDNTIRSYKADLNCFSTYCFKYKKLDDPCKANRAIINSYLKFLYGKNLSSLTVTRRLVAIRSFFKFLKRNNSIILNGLDSVKGPKSIKKLPEIISERQIDSLLNEILVKCNASSRDVLVIELFYSTGIRVSEITKIELKHINFNKNTIKIIGKGNSERIVIFGKRLLFKLEKYVDKLCIGQKFLFQSNLKKTVKPLSSKTIYNIVKKYFKLMAKNEKLSPHSIRHSFATHMLNNGADILTVKELLGHKSLSSTQIYTQVQTSKIKKTYFQSHPHGK